MNKLALTLIGLSFVAVSCGEQKAADMSPEETRQLEAEIENLESEASEIENIKTEIDQKSEELDAALNEL